MGTPTDEEVIRRVCDLALPTAPDAAVLRRDELVVLEGMLQERHVLLVTMRNIQWVRDDVGVRRCPLCKGIHPEDHDAAIRAFLVHIPRERRGHAELCPIAPFGEKGP